MFLDYFVWFSLFNLLKKTSCQLTKVISYNQLLVLYKHTDMKYHTRPNRKYHTRLNRTRPDETLLNKNLFEKKCQR